MPTRLAIEQPPAHLAHIAKQFLLLQLRALLQPAAKAPEHTILELVTDILHFTARQRLVILRHGELVIKVAPDPERPLRVRSAEGEISALGTRFLVAQQEQATRLVVLQHSVQARLFSGLTLDLQEGQAAMLYPRSIVPMSGDQRYRADWLRARLNVLVDPLEDVVAALRPYTRGFVRVAPEVRGLRVQGVYPLDNPERAFTALAETLPIRVDHYSPWLTIIRPA